MKYYNTDAIRVKDAHYNFVIGERSNGKTTALLRDILRDYHQTGQRGAVVRQMEMDIQGHKGASLFNGVVAGGMVAELTEGEWTGVKYKNRAYYLTKEDEETGETRTSPEPFCFIFALSQQTHYKSNSYPNVGTIMFDEFMRADHVYLVDEVSIFLNMVSTIVREKDHAKIFLVANTVSWNSPYFKAFGLRNINQMKPGDLATFDYKKKRATGADLVMKVAVEYTEDTASYGGKPSDVYFVIDDEHASMITDGSFAIPEYPKCPHAFGARNVKITYWIDTGERMIRIRLLKVERDLFMFAETVSEELFDRSHDPRRDLFYSLEFSGHRNHYTNPAMLYKDARTAYLADSFRTNRIFFDSNETGEDLMYYLNQAAARNVTAL